MTRKTSVSWERFEEQTKLAFVGAPLNSRFFIKTRVSAIGGVKVVARVSHHTTKSTPASSRSPNERNETVKYSTANSTNLYRLTRLLRFVLQEVLGSATALRMLAPVDMKQSDSLSHKDKKTKNKEAGKK